MRKIVVCVLAAAWIVTAVGCSESGGPSPTEKKFQGLYKQYASRFHEKMVTQAEQMAPVNVYAEAARMWDEVFVGQKDLLTQRNQEILNELDSSQPIQEDLYYQIASATRSEEQAQPQGIVLKQFLWNPLGAAQMALDGILTQVLDRNSLAVRSVLMANARPAWEVLDRSVEHPKLVQRLGPMVYLIDLSRKDDYYQWDKIRWLRPKSMGPPPVFQVPSGDMPSGELPSGALPPPAPGPAVPTPPPPGTGVPAPPVTTPAPKG